MQCLCPQPASACPCRHCPSGLPTSVDLQCSTRRTVVAGSRKTAPRQQTVVDGHAFPKHPERVQLIARTGGSDNTR
eukprot:5003163-Amphidinium_carterae.1